ncbi:hypothetical protein N9889_01350, partial [bacterium]|nr:hypothetical protein [bacterium]MDB4681894.1 hypothetical protein [Akkermansiaceae bacterium]
QPERRKNNGVPTFLPKNFHLIDTAISPGTTFDPAHRSFVIRINRKDFLKLCSRLIIGSQIKISLTLIKRPTNLIDFRGMLARKSRIIVELRILINTRANRLLDNLGHLLLLDLLRLGLLLTGHKEKCTYRYGENYFHHQPLQLAQIENQSQVI